MWSEGGGSVFLTILLCIIVDETSTHTTSQPTRTFFGLKYEELVQLHEEHVFNLASLYNTSYGGIDEYSLMQDDKEFPWNIPVNKTCPELNWTFKYEEPFLHMSLPVCGDVIRPEMLLYYNELNCTLDPLNLPNNITSDCIKNLNLAQADEIVIVTHGFLKSISSVWMVQLSTALMQKNKTTAVLLVGWGHGSGGLPFPDPFYYYQAAANTRYMGVAVGQMLSYIVEQVNMLTNSLEHKFKLHCIGHSLGAHICGFTGQYVHKYAHFGIRRISGLDPAGPLFVTDVPYPFNFIKISEEARLNRNSADFVDVIHTDGRARFSFEVVPQYGTMLELGHVDFYPGSDLEFGWNQPGCWQVADIGSCSHSRSHDLFISSLEVPCPALQVCDNTTFIPNSCNNLTSVLPTMGYYVDREKFDGRAFTVLTDATLPFCVTEKYNNL